jgi:hypothetical protein
VILAWRKPPGNCGCCIGQLREEAQTFQEYVRSGSQSWSSWCSTTRIATEEDAYLMYALRISAHTSPRFPQHGRERLMVTHEPVARNVAILHAKTSMASTRVFPPPIFHNIPPRLTRRRPERFFAYQALLPCHMESIKRSECLRATVVLGV